MSPALAGRFLTTVQPGKSHPYVPFNCGYVVHSNEVGTTYKGKVRTLGNLDYMSTKDDQENLGKILKVIRSLARK